MSKEFYCFQRQYLTVYFLVMFADWLQGTNMYTLYQGYGINVGTLFLTGFLSSGIFSTFIGPLIDRWGRQRSCMLFCILEIVINVLEHFPNFSILFCSRILGGISTSLLFAAFESWMVTEHRKREELLANMYCKASVGNGLLAITAGFISHLMSTFQGDIGPFQLSIVVTIIALIKVHQWEENYGASTIMYPSTSVIFSNSEVCLVGLGYSFFEGAMYTFVFLWVPTLQFLFEADSLPTGLIFSAFMLCVTIGGRIYAVMHGRISDEAMACFLTGLSAISMSMVSLCNSFMVTLFSFFLFEICIGAFAACSATLRSHYIGSNRMGATLSAFRVPLNIIVVLGTKLSDYLLYTRVFQFCTGVLLIACACHFRLYTSNTLTKVTHEQPPSYTKNKIN